MALLNLQNINLHFGNTQIFDNISIQIHEGEKISLLGRNGSGKSTIMKLINGEIEFDSGSIIKEKSLRTSLLPQDVPQNLSGSVYDIVMQGISPLLSPENHLDRYEERKAIQQVDKVLSLISIDSNLLYENLSAGMKRRVLLARALANDPDILLLDEPTNHLDIESIQWLEEFLSRYNKTVFFVTHDRALLQKVAGRIIEIDRGKLFDWECDYQTFLRRKDAWLESEETQNKLFDKRLSQEEAWIRKGIKARRTRNEGRVRELEKMRLERSMRRERQGTVRMELQKTESSGKLVIEAEDISFGYTSNKIINSFSTIIERGDRIAVMGPNGCGKTTLIKLLLNELKIESGNIKYGVKIETAYFDQLRNQLDENKSVRENVSDGNDFIDFSGRNRHVIGYLQDFLFPPDTADVKVKVLSGGEKNRLLLAKLFTRPFNLLIMDEPTNDLDIETIELLEDILLDYKGTLLFISHDRTFINNVSTCVLAFGNNADIKEYAGGYDDWLRKKTEALSKEPVQSKTVREKNQAKKKLSFKEKALLDSLPHIIEEKEKRKHEIYNLMADPSFYKQSGDKVTEIKSELEELEKELESLFTQWDELETYEKSLSL